MGLTKNNLRKFREKQGLTQERLAKKVGVTRQTIISIEVGTYFIFAGFVGLIGATLTEIMRRDRTVDERMQFVATKAMRLTFLCLIITAFITMVIDGIRPITIPYHMFMSYLVSGILAVYYISYKILLRLY